MALKSLQSVFKTELAKIKQLKMAAQFCRVVTDLPVPLQRYFEFCGYTGKECARAVTVDWESAWLKLALKGKWKKVVCTQINVLPQPVRLFYIRRKLLGVFPFGAIDEFMQNNSQMLIKLLNFFTVSHATGKEMDKAELVTILAETILIPAYALQYYITWKQLNPNCVKGTINYKGICASGLFYFGEAGQILSFETNDRYYTTKTGEYVQTRWLARVDSYRPHHGGNIPSAFATIWRRPEGDFEYFKGTIAAIRYTPFETFGVGAKPGAVNSRYISHPKLAFP
ncbi:hypothetical protein BDD43_3789 [Mucilaginibacter gracilis]|uniref:Uncharacterized protein n=1 Tax=Mucilaginibacter gracilis TaxID=423350 RepID=A0A495J6E1_9SPHI|nr:DUF6544 family protein [Mucilaginibacter gracilis]RKR83579.1 hypothetical protein BDD43_3789 [Mucilaginibacter gracilis]